MDACTVETGLLRKKPCGQPGVSKCANCEQTLCAKHRVPQVTAGKKTGGFLCPECARAWRESEKMSGELPPPPRPAAKPAAKPAAPTKEPPREHSGEVSFTAATNAPPQEPAAAAPAPEKPEPPHDDSSPLEFTPQPKKPDPSKK